MILFTRNFLDCARRLAWPVLILCGFTWAVLASRSDTSAAEPALGSQMGLWMHLPALIICATAFAAALETWPLLSKNQVGRKQLGRLQVGPLQGCGAAISGAILALASALIVIGLCFELLASSRQGATAARAVSVAQAKQADLSAAAALDRRIPAMKTLGFTLQDDWEIFGLDLRPQAALLEPERYEPANIQVFGDGELLNGEPLLVSSSGELISLRFSPRRLRSMEIRALDFGDFRVSFPNGSIRALSAQEYSSWLNGLLAALSYLFPASLALGAICLLGRDCSKPVCLGLAAAILIASTLAELTPNSAALQAYSRGLWIPSSDLREACLLSLLLFLGLLVIAVPLRRGVRP
ncbi:MAG: hypothetical protein ACYTG5_09210 [Planctomycetota bacterium]